MPIYKYKTFEEAEAHLKELQPSDPLARLKRLERLLRTLLPRKPIQRGLFRFRTLEEANRHREETQPLLIRDLTFSQVLLILQQL